MQPEHWPKQLLVILAALVNTIGDVLWLLCVVRSKSGQLFANSPHGLPVGGDCAAKMRITVEAPLHAWLDTSTQLTDNVKHLEGEENVRLLAWTVRHCGGGQVCESERTNLLSSLPPV